MHFRILFLISFIVFFFSCENKNTQVEEKSNHTHKEASEKTMAKITTDCINCGMPADAFPKWNVKFKTKSGDLLWTCSPKCMFNKILDEKDFLNLVENFWVTDYYEQKRIEAKTAFFVIKSDVIGPMGNDFVPHKDAEAANDFLKEHKGLKVLKFDGVDKTILVELDKK